MDEARHRRRCTHLAWSLTGAIALMAIAIAATASAHNVSFNTSVTIDRAVTNASGGSTISGTVSSPKHKCEVGREVVVFHNSAGGYVQLRTTRSGSNGRWQTNAPPLPAGASIFAVVEARIHSRPGHVHKCKASRKGKAIFPQP